MAYSFSQLQNYKQCPLKYRFEKIDNIKPDIPSESLHLILGSCVHSTLEELYKKVSDLVVPEKSESLSIFKELWEKEIERATKVYGRNPFDKDILEVFYNRWTEYINYYYDNYSPFDQAITMKTEMNVAFEMEEWLSFRGKIDRLDINNKTIIINDYKTSKSLPKDWNNTIEDQITLYSIGIKKDYGKQIDKIIGRVIYLHLQREHEREITDERLEEIKNKYLDIMEEVEQKKVLYKWGNEEAFPPTPGYACDNCLFKQLCPIYKHQYMTDEMVSVGSMGEMTIKHLIEEFATTSAMYKQLETEKDMLSSTLVEYAKEKGCKKLYGESKKLALTQKTTYSIIKETLDILQEKLSEKNVLEEVMAVDYNKLWKKFQTNELDYLEFKDLVSKKETLYISRTSDLKEDEMDLEVCGIE